MTPEQLTVDDLEFISFTYACLFYPEGALIKPLYVSEYLQEQVIRDILSYGSHEARVGSRWTPHSKLYIQRDEHGQVTVEFNPNFDQAEKAEYAEQYAQALQQGEAFAQVVLEYLSSQTR